MNRKQLFTFVDKIIKLEDAEVKKINRFLKMEGSKRRITNTAQAEIKKLLNEAKETWRDL